MTSTLSPLQEELLTAFVRREGRFFLTGGAALAGFHLGHRSTADLDLFTTEASVALEEGEAALRSAAEELGASSEALRTSPEFRRWLVRRGEDAVLVDLVLDRTPQVHGEKLLVGSVHVDPPDEILANKLCALLSRAELRDLVDVLALEGTGLRVEDAMDHAAQKDRGLTPGQLGYVLSQITLGDDANVPGGVSVEELRRYLHQLQVRLARLAMPRDS